MNCVAKAPPKSDDGQSPLQVAIKRASGVGHTKIISYLLEVGADPNKMDSNLRSVWRVVLTEKYQDSDDADYHSFLTGVTTRLMDLMIAHGANIYRSGPFPKDDPRYAHLYPFIVRNQILVDNLIFNRELMHGIDPEDDWITKQPWITLMRPYYAKDNPYYGAVVSEERKAFFDQL